MIGILCSNFKERAYAQKLHTLYQKLKGQYDSPIIVFTISNINFNNKTVSGSLVSGEKISRANVPLPPVIFNLAHQRDKDGIRRQRYLAGIADVTLVNQINRFDQWMIMEMLSVSRTTAKNLLPYHIYNKNARDFSPDDDKSYIAMPSRGASLSRIIYARTDPKSDSITGTQYFKKGHICDYIDASLCQRRWIFMEVPDILTHNNRPVIIRTYLQRGASKAWMVIGRNIYPRLKLEDSGLLKKVDEASLVAIRHISNFIPTMGHCFFDCILGSDDNPYFLHLGGFDQNFLYQRQGEMSYKQFYRNILDFADCCGHA